MGQSIEPTQTCTRKTLRKFTCGPGSHGSQFEFYCFLDRWRARPPSIKRELSLGFPFHTTPLPLYYLLYISTTSPAPLLPLPVLHHHCLCITTPTFAPPLLLHYHNHFCTATPTSFTSMASKLMQRGNAEFYVQNDKDDRGFNVTVYLDRARSDRAFRNPDQAEHQYLQLLPLCSSEKFSCKSRNRCGISFTWRGTTVYLT